MHAKRPDLDVSDCLLEGVGNSLLGGLCRTSECLLGGVGEGVDSEHSLDGVSGSHCSPARLNIIGLIVLKKTFPNIKKSACQLQCTR